MNENFRKPNDICRKLLDVFEEKYPNRIYDYLKNFGMYEPNRRTWDFFVELKNREIWKVVERYFNKYRKLWGGPDIPVYIFPINNQSPLNVKKGKLKSGVSFKDKMFLFLTPIEDDKEIEALFVHEYHHVCRLNKQKKEIEEYTLLDSMVLEGLAETAVRNHCGEEYVAEWCSYYSDKELESYWNKYIKNSINVTKKEKSHDALLYGLGRYPKLLGYAIGYKLVSSNEDLRHFSTKTTFEVSTEDFKKYSKN